jgi:transcriptional regulator with XRE-family HTH domain
LAKSLRSREHRVLLAVLKETRAEAGLTQREFADLLGWSKTKYANVESGERRLDVVEFKHIARVLKLDPVELFARFANR